MNEPTKLQTPLTRFWAYVSKNGPVHQYDSNLGRCWVWVGKMDSNGYGSTFINGEKLAHRASWNIHKTTSSKGWCVCHSCDNPSCVNPSHLWLGTKGENTKDMFSKGRSMQYASREKMARGERSAKSNLTDINVRIIRRLFAEGKGRANIARIYKVHYCTIDNIVKRKTWKHI